jgi:catechol 2,3-dioxygenase-like lactoylglutathione lyase family enzyme
MNLNRIHQISVYAKDLDQTISFYRDTLGAKFLQKFDPPGLVFFDFSGTRLLLEQTGQKATLYFRVDDIEAAHEELKSKGVEFLQGPHMIFRDESGMFGSAGEEEWMAFFGDPSGNTLALATRKRAG